jgi:hypothetical protein
MSPFKFTEEATLYAREFEVVDEMRKRFEANLAEFFDAIAAALQERSWPGKLVAARSGKSFYVYVSHREQPSAELDPCLWCYWLDPGIIRDQGLCLSVARPNASPDERARLAGIAEHPDVKPSVSGVTGGRWSIFDIWLGWDDGDDPPRAIAMALEPILRAVESAT